MSNTGKITVINNDLKYGFVKVPKIGDVFFSPQTQFQGTSFDSLKVGDSADLLIIETERGLFAKTLELSSPKRKDRSPEVSV